MSGAILTLMAAAGGSGGGGSTTITVNPQYIYAFAVAPSTATALYQLNSSGIAYEIVNGGAALSLGDWCTPHSQATNYECYATLVSGFLSSGSSALNTWLALSSTQSWKRATTSGDQVVVINVGIRRVGDTAILASADITLEAEVT